MASTNNPTRAGRKRGQNMIATPARPWREVTTRSASSRKDRKLIARNAQLRSPNPPRAKRRRGEPAPIGGFTGKEAAHWSAYRENRSNVKRKPEARRTPAVKKALRRGKSPGVVD